MSMQTLPKRKEKEPGNAIDLMASGFVLLFCILMILFTLSYAEVVELKLEADMIGKNYLYRMEQEGYLSPDGKSEMIAAFQEKEMQVIINLATTIQQVPYGEPVTLDVNITCKNPVYEQLQNNWLINTIIKPELKYHLNYTTTSKW